MSRGQHDVVVRSGDLRAGAVLVTPVSERAALGGRRRWLATVTEWEAVPAGEACGMDLFDAAGRCLRCGSPKPISGTAHTMPAMVAYTVELGPGWIAGCPPVERIARPDDEVLVTAASARRLAVTTPLTAA